MNKSNMIDKDDLTYTAVAVEDMKILIDDINGFFCDRNTDNEKDVFKIRYEFAKYRAYADILERLINSVQADFKKLGL